MQHASPTVLQQDWHHHDHRTHARVTIQNRKRLLGPMNTSSRNIISALEIDVACLFIISPCWRERNGNADIQTTSLSLGARPLHRECEKGCGLVATAVNETPYADTGRPTT